MPISLLDIGLIAVMLVSGILAMVRGFMREVLSIAAWVIAALVTLYGYAKAVPYAKQYIANDLCTGSWTCFGTTTKDELTSVNALTPTPKAHH